MGTANAGKGKHLKTSKRKCEEEPSCITQKDGNMFLFLESQQGLIEFRVRTRNPIVLLILRPSCNDVGFFSLAFFMILFHSGYILTCVYLTVASLRYSFVVPETACALDDRCSATHNGN